MTRMPIFVSVMLFLAAVLHASPSAWAKAKADGAAAPAASGDDACRGTLEIDGKSYELRHTVAYPVKALDEDGYAVIFCQDAIPVDKLSKSLRDSNGGDDGLFLFKPHVKVNFRKDGSVMFCNAYADNNSVSISGSRDLVAKLAVKDGRAKGEAALKQDPESKRKNSFKLEAFDLPLLSVPPATNDKGAAGKPEKSKPAAPAPGDNPADAAPAGKPIAARELPLPEGATEVQYKKLVEQITCKSPNGVKPTAQSLVKALEAQGWKTKGADLLGAKSTILNRTRGDATLTIFVKPVGEDGAASTVQFMTKGLTWDDESGRAK